MTDSKRRAIELVSKLQSFIVSRSKTVTLIKTLRYIARDFNSRAIESCESFPLLLAASLRSRMLEMRLDRASSRLSLDVWKPVERPALNQISAEHVCAVIWFFGSQRFAMWHQKVSKTPAVVRR